MAVKNCEDCDYVSHSALRSNGKCRDCHGTGYKTDVQDALADALSGQSQTCTTSNGTGDCQTCGGKGYIDD